LKTFYIASGLGNAEQTRMLAARLKAAGWGQTYDWTKHGAVDSKEDLQRVSQLEMKGAMEAELVIVLLPGGRGTHTELGMALASGNQVLINDETGEAFNTGEETCSFYHHPAVWKTALDIECLATMLTLPDKFGKMFAHIFTHINLFAQKLKHLGEKSIERRCNDETQAKPQGD